MQGFEEVPAEDMWTALTEKEAMLADYGMSDELFVSDAQPLEHRCKTTANEPCSCQYRDHFGLPCRHEFRALKQLNVMALDPAWIDPHWLNKTEEAERVHLRNVQAMFEELPKGPEVKLQAEERYQNTMRMGKVCAHCSFALLCASGCVQLH